jgi:type I restriction enzyme M protein
MLIAWDWKSHIFKLNSLDTSSWGKSDIKEKLRQFNLIKTYWNLEKDKQNEEELKELKFDVLLANPPFAWKITDKKMLTSYDLWKNEKWKLVNQTSRHILFIEKNLNVVREWWRLALVLPQWVFNNTSEEYIRKYIMKRARILAVVWLDGNTFKPHTWTKTSVLFLQKWKENELDEWWNPKIKNYPIFFATSKLPFKDNSWNYIYKENETWEKVLQNDLEDIVEAFKIWGNEQGFDFLVE